MDKFINPPELHGGSRRRRWSGSASRPKKNPAEPERDVLLFLLENAPLEHWERDVLEIVRDEAYYFAPQAQTKIMNEGWASYWHSQDHDRAGAEGRPRSSTTPTTTPGVLATAPGQFNPYKLGIELLPRHRGALGQGAVRQRVGRVPEPGRSGASWDKRLGLGRKKIFEVRKLYNDVTFIDEFFTADFCERNKFFSFSLNERTGNYEIDSREFKKIKDKMLFPLTNFGDPFIFVEDANYENRGELLLRHRHEGTDLQIDHARETLTALVRIWRRPVNLLTAVDGKQKLFRFDGKEQVEKSIGN